MTAGSAGNTPRSSASVRRPRSMYRARIPTPSSSGAAKSLTVMKRFLATSSTHELERGLGSVGRPFVFGELIREVGRLGFIAEMHRSDGPTPLLGKDQLGPVLGALDLMMPLRVALGRRRALEIILLPVDEGDNVR